jgi:hypothetical protein
MPAVAAFATHAPLRTCIRIAAGLVVAGDLIEAGEAPERSIIRETPHLAARSRHPGSGAAVSGADKALSAAVDDGRRNDLHHGHWHDNVGGLGGRHQGAAILARAWCGGGR